MDYFLVIISVFFVAVQFSLSKLYQSKYASGIRSLLLFPLLVSAVGCLFFFVVNGLQLQFNSFTFVMALCLGAVMSVNFLLSVVVVKFGKISIYTIFMMLGGMMLPYAYGLLFLGEKISIFGIIGMVILTGSMVLPMIEKKSGEAKTSKILLILCAVIFCVNGTVSVLSKVHQVSSEALSTNNFLIWTYIFSFAFTGIAIIVYTCIALMKRKKAVRDSGKSAVNANYAVTGAEQSELQCGARLVEQSSAVTERNRKTAMKGVLVIAMYALVSGSGYMMQLIGAKSLPASILYPIITGGSIILSAVAGLIFFKEKISRNTFISLIMTLFGTILFLF